MDLSFAVAIWPPLAEPRELLSSTSTISKLSVPFSGSRKASAFVRYAEKPYSFQFCQDRKLSVFKLDPNPSSHQDRQESAIGASMNSDPPQYAGSKPSSAVAICPLKTALPPSHHHYLKARHDVVQREFQVVHKSGQIFPLPFFPLRDPYGGYVDYLQQSPLYFFTREPMINNLCGFLNMLKRRVGKSDPLVRYTLAFTREQLVDARLAFRRAIRGGELKLHKLGSLLTKTLGGSYSRRSVANLTVRSTGQSMVIMRTLGPEDVPHLPDMEDGCQVPFCGVDHDVCSGVSVQSSSVEYLPKQRNPANLHRIVTRVKREKELWSKVCDEIFKLDMVVRRDKQFRSLSPFVKDVFGLKAVVEDDEAARELQRSLEGTTWTAEELREVDVERSVGTESVMVLEVKDYISKDSEEHKDSGWEALKSVVNWFDQTFEIQIQSLWSFHQEQERLTNQSHDTWADNREKARRAVAQRFPLYSFYQELLEWVFLQPFGTPPPSFPNIQVVLCDALPDLSPPSSPLAAYARPLSPEPRPIRVDS